jgi:hypothetical protein
MKRANRIQSRIEEHGKGLGTADDDLVNSRAREIAITNGRRGDQITTADLDQARQELRARNAPLDPADDHSEEELASREGLMGVSTGRSARIRPARDEQTQAEDLVAEGLEEAAHEQMVEGNRISRQRDQAFDDQLPSAG